MTKKLKIVLAQINSVVGDIAGNSARIQRAIEQAHACQADVLFTPELALSGCPAGDLLLCDDFLQSCESACQQLARASGELTFIVGHPAREGGAVFNCASVFRQGRCIGRYRKRSVDLHGVLDEARYFTAGTEILVVDLDGLNIALAIGDDVACVLSPAKEQGADIVLRLAAMPFAQGDWQARLQTLSSATKALALPLLSCNLIGGQDDLLFAGRSFALDRQGQCVWQASAFQELQSEVQFGRDGFLFAAVSPSEQAPACAEIYQALVLGVRDYVEKNAFPGVLIGLSGGIDSALALLVAVDALGAERVRTVMMASPYTAEMSLQDARLLARQLKVRHDEIAIEPAMRAFDDLLQPFFAGLALDTTEENLQSRIRGTLLMALANKSGFMVLATGNKSEFATGYATLYGDMAGGFAVLKDVYKTDVYKISWWLHETRGVIPVNILQRAPSAELRADQTDQDSLPPYDILDGILYGLIECNQSPDELIANNWPQQEVLHVATLLRRNEHKRRQAPPGVRVSQRAFGSDRRYPITAHDWRRATSQLEDIKK